MNNEDNRFTQPVNPYSNSTDCYKNTSNNGANISSYTSPYTNSNYWNRKESDEEKAGKFQLLLLPSIIYAILFVVLCFRAASGITTPFFAVSTVVYCLYMIKAFSKVNKKQTYFYAVVICLLGLSSFITANEGIQFFDFIGIFVITLLMLINAFYDDSKWGSGRFCLSYVYAIAGTISSVGDFFMDFHSYNNSKASNKNKAGLYVFIGLAATVPILGIVIALLAQSDVVFAHMISTMLDDIDIPTIFLFTFMLCFGFFAPYCSVRYLTKGTLDKEVRDAKRANWIIGFTVSIPLFISYFVFSIIQILYLFTACGKLPYGLTYAQYAHRGFYSLIVVCLINLILVSVAINFFTKHKAFTISITLITLCTFIMLASAFYRVILYIKAYYLSLARLQAIFGIIIIAVLLIGILTLIAKNEFNYSRFAVVTICIGYLLFAYSMPDYWVASYNLSVDFSNKDSELDTYYLCHLSADAAPALKENEEVWKEWKEAYKDEAEFYDRNYGCSNNTIRSFNLSYLRADRLAGF